MTDNIYTRIGSWLASVFLAAVTFGIVALLDGPGWAQFGLAWITYLISVSKWAVRPLVVADVSGRRPVAGYDVRGAS